MLPGTQEKIRPQEQACPEALPEILPSTALHLWEHLPVPLALFSWETPPSGKVHRPAASHGLALREMWALLQGALAWHLEHILG